MAENHDGTPLSRARAIIWAYLLSLAFWLLSIGTFWRPLRKLLALSLNDTLYSHLILVPLISGGLIYWKRREIFQRATYDLRAGIPLLAVGLAAGGWLSRRFLPSSSDLGLSFVILGVVFACAAGFLFLYGIRALQAAKFPLCFLLLMIPIPRVVMDRVIFVLQVGTSETLYFLFRLTGTSLYRHGFTFELPGAAIVISEECSSIHSVWALFIISLVLGHFFLRSTPAKTCLSLLTIPIAIFTNAVRIMTIWLLAVYVNSDFMYGNLRQNAGVLFSLVSLSNLLLSLWLLRQLDSRFVADRPFADSARPVAPPSSMLSDWSGLSTLANFSCQLTFGKSVSYQPADGPTCTAVGLLERASNQERESLRIFLQRGELATSPDPGDQVTIEENTYAVVEVQNDEAGGTWLSLRAIA